MSVVTPPLDHQKLPEGFWEAIGMTSEIRRDIDIYLQMLSLANLSTNLVGASTLSDFERRHFIDSAQLLWLETAARRWADLGSGAGLPGIILAILLKGRPGVEVHLVESMGKRCRFLADVASRLSLPVKLHHARAEDLKLNVEIVTARACAPLGRLLGYAEPFLSRGARGLFLKGREVEREILDAKAKWTFSSRTHDSLSDPRGRVLAVEKLSHV